VKVLLVDPDASRASTLREALTAAGAEVAVAPSGAFALTMLERNRQDAIVSRAWVEDMRGHELCAILRSDPEARDVRFVLVAGQDDTTPARTADAGIDLVVPPSMNESRVLCLIVQLVSRARAQPPAVVTAAWRASLDSVVVDLKPAPAEATDDTIAIEADATAEEPAPDFVTGPAHEMEPVRSPSTEPMAASPVSAPPPARANGAPLPSRTFQGSLAVMGIEELTQAIAVGGKTGRLILALGEGGGLVAFESGRIVHAEFGDTLGEEAFAALLAVSLQEQSGKFCFIPSDAAALAALPKTIAKSVDQLLLSAAAAVDAGAPAAAYTSLEER
jgi:CheY-like chemotaxis protein